MTEIQGYPFFIFWPPSNSFALCCCDSSFSMPLCLFLCTSLEFVSIVSRDWVDFAHISCFHRFTQLSFFFYPPFFHLLLSHSFPRSSRLQFSTFRLPGLLFTPLSLLPPLPCFVLLLPSCTLLLSSTLWLPLFKPSFPFILSSLIPILPSHILSSQTHSSSSSHCLLSFLLLPLPFTPLFSLPILDFFFHLLSPPPLS